jgi:ureidoglycolate lyase
MRLVRVRHNGHEKPSLLDADGYLRDLTDPIPDINGATVSEYNLKKLRALDLTTLARVPGNSMLGPCIGKKLNRNPRNGLACINHTNIS